MTHDILKYLGAASIAAILAAAPAFAQDQSQSMTDMDTDQSGTVSQDEFAEGYDPSTSNLGKRLDTDQSGGVNEQEFAEGGSAASEASGNQAWSDQDFSEADTDQSGELSPDEISGVIFVIYDADRSGDLNEQEYQTYQEDEQAMGEDNM